jgi:hypothetical protein
LHNITTDPGKLQPLNCLRAKWISIFNGGEMPVLWVSGGSFVGGNTLATPSRAARAAANIGVRRLVGGWLSFFCRFAP